MKKKLLTLAVGSVLCAGSSIASAAPFNSFDPRSMAMGGAGVAIPSTATAPFFNPSLLAVTREEDTFDMELPIIGGRAYDPDDFVDSVDDFQDAEYDTALNNAIDQITFDVDNGNLLALPGDYLDAATATARLDAGLRDLSEKPIQAELGAATVIGIPSKTFGIAFSASGTATVGGVFNYEDEAFLGGIAGDMATIASTPACYTNPAACPTDLTYIDTDPASSTFLEVINEDGTPFDATEDVKSTVDVRGILVREIGLSFAREFAISGATFAVGVTPKYTKVTVYDYQANANTADNDDFDADDYSKDYADINLDIGVAKNYNNGWRTGFVVKNLIKHEYDTYRLNPDTGTKEKTGNSVELKPQARIGVSHQTDFYTVGLDVDLTKNDPVGFEDESRYVSVGGEINLVDWAQLRAGYRFNTVNSDRNIPSLGLGLSPMGIHFDIAVATNSDELGASAQFGFRF